MTRPTKYWKRLRTGDNPYTIKRVNVPRSLSLDGFIKKIQGLPE